MNRVYIGRIPVRLPDASGAWVLVFPFSAFEASEEVYVGRPRLERVLISVEDFVARVNSYDEKTLRAWSRYADADPTVDLRSALLAIVPSASVSSYDNLGKRTGAQLASMCEDLGIPYRGTKAEKIARIEEAIGGG